MLNLKNNFLWEFIANAKLQNPIEKFDKEFWEKTEQTIKEKTEQTIKEASELLDCESPKGVNKSRTSLF